MAITGSVFATGLGAGAHQITLPQANMNIVGVIFSGSDYVSIPIDASHNAIIPLSGTSGVTSSVGNVTPMIRVDFVVNGTALNFTLPSTASSANVFFYYGTPLIGSRPLRSYAGVVGTATMSSGAGSATLQFPSGPLQLNGMTAHVSTLDNAQLTFATSTGQVFTLNILLNQIFNVEDIVALSLTVAQQLAVNITSGSSTVVDVFAFYQY